MLTKVEDKKTSARPTQQHQHAPLQEPFFNKEKDNSVPGKTGSSGNATPSFFAQRKPDAKDNAVPPGSRSEKDLATQAPQQGFTEDYFHLPLLRADEALINSMRQLGSTYVDFSTAVIDTLSIKLRVLSLNYETAFSRYAHVVGKGASEAANQTMMNGIMLGIATGVLASLGTAWLLPATVSGGLELSSIDALVAGGTSGAQGVVTSAIGAAVGDLITEAGTNMQPTGLAPEVLNSRMWQHVSTMYRDALRLNPMIAKFAMLSRLMTAAIGEARVLMAGGASDKTPQQLEAEINAMIAYTAKLTPIAEELSRKTSALIEFSKLVDSFDPMSKSTREIEKDIWIMWMAGISYSDYDILDLNVIENYLHNEIKLLGPDGDLGVDFGYITEPYEERAAIKAAKARNFALLQEYDQAVSRWNMSASGDT